MNNKVPKIVQKWCDSISNRNPSSQLSFYAKDSILLATYSNFLIGKEDIYHYFIDFLDKNELRCKINYNITQFIGLDDFVASGIYTFKFLDNYNNLQVVKARYTFVVEKNKIVNHHSSVLPN
jgi:uncharacterized protein (TIGR02246 family)